jgi:hypothetical protein
MCPLSSSQYPLADSVELRAEIFLPLAERTKLIHASVRNRESPHAVVFTRPGVRGLASQRPSRVVHVSLANVV